MQTELQSSAHEGPFCQCNPWYTPLRPVDKTPKSIMNKSSCHQSQRIERANASLTAYLLSSHARWKRRSSQKMMVVRLPREWYAARRGTHTVTFHDSLRFVVGGAGVDSKAGAPGSCLVLLHACQLSYQLQHVLGFLRTPFTGISTLHRQRRCSQRCLCGTGGAAAR